MAEQNQHFDIVIFDCDGVILDSNALKSQAFEQTLQRQGIEAPIISEFLTYHHTHGGISRYKKFEELMQRWLNNWPNEQVYQQLLSDYSSLCVQLYQQSVYTRGALALIQHLHKAGKKLYVASGSDEQELRQVFAQKDLAQYFEAIYGSPKTKSEIVADLVNHHAESRCLMIGDAISDLKAAQQAGISFRGMLGYSDNPDNLREQTENSGYPIIADLTELRIS